MKKKNNVMVLVLVALVLVLGVGYAVVSSVTLTISGTAKVADSNLNVVFNGTTAVSSAEKVTATAQADSLTANITVTGLTAVNETVTATYTIENKEADLDASVIKDSIEVSKSEFFEVTTDMDSTAKTVAKNNGTNTVTVTVKVKKLPIEEADSTTNITVKLKATPVQPGA